MEWKRLIYLLTLALPLVPAAVSCASECMPAPEETDGGRPIELSGQKEHVITRAGDETEEFETGTLYWLHGVNQTGTWQEGEETSNHTIDYNASISYGNTPMDFYGITYGSTELPDEDDLDSEALTVTESVRDDGSLPDLMFSNNLQGMTLDDGYRLEMDFKHAMSRLKFMIVKQDESEDTEKKLENVTLKSIVVNGTRSSGTLDVKDGKWTYAETDSYADRTYYSDEMSIGINSAEVPVKVPGTEYEELLVFPNKYYDANNNEVVEEVTITVTLGGFSDGDKSVDYVLRSTDETGKDTGPLPFEMNHEYTLLITVLKDDVRTIAIAPQVYDWVDVDHENYLGQPVTFANLMWMDRNLGAKSADCYNDWENCRGYYYQYARNIPFILDKEKYDAAETKTPIYQFLYTFNQKGERVYGGLTVNTTEIVNGVEVKVQGRENIAVNPGDDGFYQFIVDVGNVGIWMYNDTGPGEDPFVDQFWTSSSDNHPCPKGWRLPTIRDFATFMPERSFSGTWYNGFTRTTDYIGNQLGYREDEVHGNINGERAIYIIKRKGQNDCYRIKIQLKESASGTGKWYFEFSYFSGDASMSFKDIDTEEEFNALGYDWSVPSSTMQVPACGFIYTSGGNKLHDDGSSTILRSSEYVRAGYNWVCYLRGDTSFGIFSGSRKALGDQIRCVRDTNVDK